MLPPRFRKILRDLWNNKARTLLVIMAIAVGVFAFGSVFITQELLLENMQLQYEKSRSSNITLFIPDTDDTLIRWFTSQPGVAQAEGTNVHSVDLLRSNGTEDRLILRSYPDFLQQQLNLLVPKRGSWPPQYGEIAFERSSAIALARSIGDELTVSSNDIDYQLSYSSIIYDNSAFPFMFTNQLNGYVSWDTMAYLGFSKSYTQVDIITDISITTLPEAEKVANDLIEALSDRGVEVNGSRVSTPNQHWAEDNSRAFTAILSIIGVFSLLLSGFLVVNTISALLSEQKKQIGIMRAIGAKSPQVVTLYLLMVGVYGFLALLIALPVGMILGYYFFQLVVNFLNLDVELIYFPPQVLAMQIAAALVVPLVAALLPIIKSSKFPVRKSISDFQETKTSGRIDRLLASISGLSRPTLISLRNVFRNRSRLILTLAMLITAGSVFISVINVRTGMFDEIDRMLELFDYQVSLNLNRDYDVTLLKNRITAQEHVIAVEARSYLSVRRIQPDGTKGVYFDLAGLPPDTVFSHPTLLQGRWLSADDLSQVVLGSGYARDNPDLSVGDEFIVDAADETHHLEIVGIVSTNNQEKFAFANFDQVTRMKDSLARASNILIKTDPSDAATQRQVADAVIDRLERTGIVVTNSQTKQDIYNSVASQLNFLIFFLLSMSVMVAVVGGLGLAGTMSLNVMDRTREIGIMRSIGAGDRIISRLVLLEGMLVGVISFILAIPISVPMTYGFCYAIGNAFFGRTLAVTVVPGGMFVWLLIISAIAVVASLLPARRASHMSISETLAYE